MLFSYQPWNNDFIKFTVADDMRLGYRAWVSQPMILMFHLSRLTEENKQNLSLLFPIRIVIIVMHSFPGSLSLVIATQNTSISLFFTLLFAASQVVIVLSGYCGKKKKHQKKLAIFLSPINLTRCLRILCLSFREHVCFHKLQWNLVWRC